MKSAISEKTFLADANEQAQSRLQLIIKQMQEAESVNEKLKAYDWMAWVQL
ncbi:MAG: TnpV protein [Mediterraneibacter sp.]